MRNRKKRKTYSLLNEMMASPISPMPQKLQTHQLTRMWQSMRDVELAENPSIDSWRCLSDSVNLLESLVVMGEVADDQGVIQDATTALHASATKYKERGVIRLDGAGITAVRAALEDYAMALSALPHRVMVRCHRLTEQRLHEILRGKRQSHDVAIM